MHACRQTTHPRGVLELHSAAGVLQGLLAEGSDAPHGRRALLL
jgi:hypothetical protein